MRLVCRKMPSVCGQVNYSDLENCQTRIPTLVKYFGWLKLENRLKMYTLLLLTTDVQGVFRCQSDCGRTGNGGTPRVRWCCV